VGKFEFADLLLTVDDALYFQPTKSFPSIAKTVLHISDAQQIWLLRMQGISLSTWPSANFAGSKKDTITALVQIIQNLVEFIKSQGESFLTSTYSYVNLKGDSFADPVETYIISHC
jgi:uncharacterized damage-inducible protein DinB